jgi:CubicO group peptidase (beta-lactamase class C family)
MNARFDEARLSQAWRITDRWVESGHVPAVSVAAGGARSEIARHHAGHQSLDGSQPLDPEAIFLIASPTKPVTALAVIMLAEAGELLMADPVARYVPEFGNSGKQAITLAQCLTHTSGLPDMLPDNLELRKRNAPLSEFVAGTCRLAPLFEPGTAVKYQSMGTLMLAEVVRRVSGMPHAQFLAERIFKPLRMHDTALGMPAAWTEHGAENHGSRRERIAELRVPAEQVGSNWGWNSDYWRTLGAPWGGLLSTAGDLGRLCQHLLQIHAGEAGILSRAALETMTTNQLARLPNVPEVDRRCRPWGYGWRLNCFNDDDAFGDFLSPKAYGHWGATGTMIWIDPARDAFAVVLTTEPMQTGGQRQSRLTNCLTGALVAGKNDVPAA